MNVNPIHPPTPASSNMPPPAKHYFGKYRGLVTENIDPLQLGRVLAQAPDVPYVLGWAMPCIPYSVPGSAPVFAVPPIGTSIWVEFEGGDPNYPIWSGCFWGPGQPALIATNS